MGVLYIVTPPTDEVRNWLAESGIPVSKDTTSRGPLLSEIRDVLDSLEGYSVDYTDNGIGSSWQAMISSSVNPESGRWTGINIIRQNASSEPQEICFEKGFPEFIVEIVARLSSRCGTLIIIPDTGCPPLVVNASDDAGKLCANWDHLKP